MQVDSGNARASRAPRHGDVLRVDAVSQPLDPSARPGTRGDTVAHRCAVKRGQQRLVLAERINLIGRITTREAEALEQTAQAAGDAGRDPRHLVVVGRWQRSKADLVGAVSKIHAVDDQRVEM
jgi:hypothetical protein